MFWLCNPKRGMLGCLKRHYRCKYRSDWVRASIDLFTSVAYFYLHDWFSLCPAWSSFFVVFSFLFYLTWVSFFAPLIGSNSYFVKLGCIPPLCEFLQAADVRLVMVALEAIENILEVIASFFWMNWLKFFDCMTMVFCVSCVDIVVRFIGWRRNCSKWEIVCEWICCFRWRMQGIRENLQTSASYECVNLWQSLHISHSLFFCCFILQMVVVFLVRCICWIVHLVFDCFLAHVSGYMYCIGCWDYWFILFYPRRWGCSGNRTNNSKWILRFRTTNSWKILVLASLIAWTLSYLLFSFVWFPSRSLFLHFGFFDFHGCYSLDIRSCSWVKLDGGIEGKF